MLTRCVLALLLVLGVGCTSGPPACPGFCSENTPATFTLTCSPTDLMDVSISGPCFGADAAPSTNLPHASSTSVQIGSPTPGVCHVTLTFASGFTYSADVTFVSQTDPAPSGCPTCSPYVTPTQRTFTVNNPTTTCVDAGAGASDSSADAPEGTAPDGAED